ncbi:MAG: hypothetical protein JRF64_07880, partial [Deltaproteobacteria bacterium]|nr:hypothetical protein [Deltaproteobacteria bacterium]
MAIAALTNTRLCLETPSSARERGIFSSGKDGEAGDVSFIVDGAGRGQAEKGPLEARSSFQTEPSSAKEESLRSKLDSPILFTKRGNYQGIHIYDTCYQWHPGGGIYILENPSDPPEKHRLQVVIDENSTNSLGKGMYFDPDLSFDAKKVLFCFKGEPDGSSYIYEIGIDGK